MMNIVLLLTECWQCWLQTCRSVIPEERYGQETEEANDELKMDPVVYQVGKQCVEASRHCPEVFDDRSCECAIFSRKQFTRHHEAGQKYTLTNRNYIVHCARRKSKDKRIRLNVMFSAISETRVNTHNQPSNQSYLDIHGTKKSEDVGVFVTTRQVVGKLKRWDFRIFYNYESSSPGNSRLYRVNQKVIP